MKDINLLDGNSIRSPGSCPRVWDLVVLGQKFNFLNMVMWHIKLKGMNSRAGYTEIFYPRINMVTIGWGQRIIRYLRERWDLRWRAIKCVLVLNI